MEEKNIALHYIGNGAWVHPYPARDLTKEEVEQFGEKALLETGLYEVPNKPAAHSAGKKEK